MNDIEKGVFQIYNKAVKEEYIKDNYLIEYNNSNETENCCVLYFSSNDIYYPNEESVFRKRIVDKNFYEWYNTRVSIARKHIFLRDIHKQWYLSGINATINSPELLLSFLEKETLGYDIVTIGSSAGGYASVLYGSQLNAKKILTFNGQFEIRSLLKTSKKEINPLIFLNENNHLSRYFDLKDITTFSENIYYFYSSKSNWDISQYKHIASEDQINLISFNTSHHGIPFLKGALLKVINLQVNELDNYRIKRNSPFIFTVKLIGLKRTTFELINQIYTKYKKRKK